MIGQRQGMIVWFYSLKAAKNLRKYGNVHYISKRLKYAVLYCDMAECEAIMEKLKGLSYVKRVEPSYRPFLKTEFESKKTDETKEELDYKLGF
ncbi:YlbG family protein [Pallidibacillus pasinlerensis]|uniref:UPF0298 protein GW534_00070 n=1 Tax=Pallidibacillus pasinlerensis TaxID=2703818 RepID=A0ABX0A2F8_9BACI|nr:YlbG family protein [Pallidibacillus pasinlerensis]NCU16169.1 YlbG family protein [Pallidibacillus pasinlerensis]